MVIPLCLVYIVGIQGLYGGVDMLCLGCVPFPVTSQVPERTWASRGSLVCKDNGGYVCSHKCAFVDRQGRTVDAVGATLDKGALLDLVDCRWSHLTSHAPRIRVVPFLAFV